MSACAVNGHLPPEPVCVWNWVSVPARTDIPVHLACIMRGPTHSPPPDEADGETDDLPFFYGGWSFLCTDTHDRMTIHEVFILRIGMRRAGDESPVPYR